MKTEEEEGCREGGDAMCTMQISRRNKDGEVEQDGVLQRGADREGGQQTDFALPLFLADTDQIS